MPHLLRSPHPPRPFVAVLVALLGCSAPTADPSLPPPSVATFPASKQALTGPGRSFTRKLGGSPKDPPGDAALFGGACLGPDLRVFVPERDAAACPFPDPALGSLLPFPAAGDFPAAAAGLQRARESGAFVLLAEGLETLSAEDARVRTGLLVDALRTQVGPPSVLLVRLKGTTPPDPLALFRRMGAAALGLLDLEEARELGTIDLAILDALARSGGGRVVLRLSSAVGPDDASLIARHLAEGGALWIPPGCEGGPLLPMARDAAKHPEWFARRSASIGLLVSHAAWIGAPKARTQALTVLRGFVQSATAWEALVPLDDRTGEPGISAERPGRLRDLWIPPDSELNDGDRLALTGLPGEARRHPMENWAADLALVLAQDEVQPIVETRRPDSRIRWEGPRVDLLRTVDPSRGLTVHHLIAASPHPGGILTVAGTRVGADGGARVRWIEPGRGGAIEVPVGWDGPHRDLRVTIPAFHTWGILELGPPEPPPPVSRPTVAWQRTEGPVEIVAEGLTGGGRTWLSFPEHWAGTDDEALFADLPGEVVCDDNGQWCRSHQRGPSVELDKEVRVQGEEIQLSMTVRNVGPMPIRDVQAMLCWSQKDTLAFPAGGLEHAAFVGLDGLRSLDDRPLGSGDPLHHNTHDWTRPLIMLRGLDERRTLGLAMAGSRDLSSNGNHGGACLHVHPHFGDLAPGDSRTRLGRLYLHPGPAAEVVARYDEHPLEPPRQPPEPAPDLPPLCPPG